MNQIFQGDVGFTKITEKELPKNLIFKKVDNFITAHGESGNTHRVVVDRPTENLVEIADAGNGIYYMRVKGEARITHEQHEQKNGVKTTLGSGIYFVSRQVEYDEVQERLVRD